MTYDFIVNGHRVGRARKRGFLAPRIRSLLMSFVRRLKGNGFAGWVQMDGSGRSERHKLHCEQRRSAWRDSERRRWRFVSEDRQRSPGGAADRAGVPAGSYLLQVDGQSMQGVAIDDVVSRHAARLTL